jgi:hypothetical protein
VSEADVDARLAAAEDTAERVEILREEVADREDRLTELREKRGVLKTERRRVKRAYAEQLAPSSVLDADEFTERFSLTELREKCDDHESAASTLDAVEPAVLSGGGSRPNTTLTEADRERVAELEARLEALPDRDDGLAAQERAIVEEELADLRGEP